MAVPELRGRLADGVRRRFGIDTRTLAAFRIVLGVVVLVNLAARTRDLVAFYTGGGVVPNAAVQEHTTLSRYSVYAVSDSFLFVVLLFLVTAVFAVALVVGYRTRLASVAVFVLVFSLNARNPLVMNGGDALFSRLLFWGVFLPLGGRWSVDAFRYDSGNADEGSIRTDSRVTTVATAAVMVQVVVVYATNAVFKLRSDPWMSGEAVREVFALTAYTTPVGSVLAGFPDLLVLLNYLWVALLVASPLLLVLTGWRRAALAATFAVSHLALLLTMNLTVFPLISVAGLVVFTPPSVWDVCATMPSRFRRPHRRFLVFADRILPRLRLLGGLSLDAPQGASFGRWRRRAVSFFVAVCLFTVLFTNASAVGYLDTPEAADEVEEYVGQKWSLFAPYPPTTDRWHTFRGKTTSGDVVDPLRLSPYEQDLRPNPYPNARWRKYLDAVQENDVAYLDAPLVRYLCERWNRRHDDELIRLEGYYVEYDGTAEKTRFVEGSCPV